MGTKPGNNHFGGTGNPRLGVGGVEILHVKQISNAQDEDFQTGRTKPPVTTIEHPQSINVVIDSRNRLDESVNSNPFNFRVTLSSNIYRSRFTQVKKVIIPRIPNITQNNNVLVVFVDLSGGLNVPTKLTARLPAGYYTTSSICNTLASTLSSFLPSPEVFVCVFDNLTQSFQLSCTVNFFISSNCNFVTRGLNFVPFLSFDENVGGLAEYGKRDIYSGISCLHYTRYVFLCSESMNNFSYANSRTSDPRINEDIIAVVDVEDLYSQFGIISSPLSLACKTISTAHEAPIISLRNTQRNLSPEMDCYVLDEYGSDLNEAFYFGNESAPKNSTGITFWMMIDF